MPTVKKAPKPKKWLHSDRYLNREHSWLQFNSRVLYEAKNKRNPLLERLKFLAIFESNLDEFYMVRVSGLVEQQESGVFELSPDGMTPAEQLTLIAKTVRPLRKEAAELWHDELRPMLMENGVRIFHYEDLSSRQRREVEELFCREIFPLCTPLILSPAPSVPFISNRSLNIAVVLKDEAGLLKLARVKVPTVVKRAIRFGKRRHQYVLAEEVIRNNLQDLFPGVKIVASHMFRVIRDADVEIREMEAGDLIDSIEQTIRMRRFGDPVLLEVSSHMPQDIKQILMRGLNLGEADVMTVDGLIGLDVLWEFSKVEKPGLRYPAHHPHQAEDLAGSKAIFNMLARTDVLVHHPFDSFRTVEDFVRSATHDPQVMGVKMTLYRVGSESPVVDTLLEAAEDGNQVAVMVELKARFDESNNLGWARALERAGAHVSYGFAELKTHCKMCLIVRRGKDGIRTYAHIGTGNYNPVTARLYTDLGFFTADPFITQDVAELFNFLTGFSKQRDYRKLLVAPLNLRDGVIKRIYREAEHGENGRIIMKMNSLVDSGIVDALYDASESGVQIDLIVRGICTLRPGIADMSSNIRVTSVVGRFLEHSRILYFENGGQPDVLIGSADLMRRNLDRRIEVLVPIENPDLVKHIRTDLLEKYLQDNVNSWVMGSDGNYTLRRPEDEVPYSVHKVLISRPTTKLLFPPELSD